MLRFVSRRLLALIPVLFIVSMLTFGGLELVPGDPLELILGPGSGGEIGNLTDEEYQALMKKHGFDQPLLVRYVKYVGRVLQGDLGRSRVTRQPVTTMLADRMEVSLWLNSITFVSNIVIGMGLGVIAGIFHGTKWDLAATLIAVTSVATPGFWLAILMILTFSLWLGWLPSSGWVSPLDDPLLGLKHLILPVFALGIFGSASILRQTRSALLEVMRQDYIVAARSRGLSERRVITRHMMKNAMLPVVTLFGFQIASLIGGSVLIERIFGLPGLGRMALDATQRRDFEVVQAIVMLSAVAIMVANLIADLLYGFLDPRIRYS